MGTTASPRAHELGRKVGMSHPFPPQKHHYFMEHALSTVHLGQRSSYMHLHMHQTQGTRQQQGLAAGRSCQAKERGPSSNKGFHGASIVPYLPPCCAASICCIWPSASVDSSAYRMLTRVEALMNLAQHDCTHCSGPGGRRADDAAVTRPERVQNQRQPRCRSSRSRAAATCGCCTHADAAVNLHQLQSSDTFAKSAPAAPCTYPLLGGIQVLPPE